ncbi:MAG TPA: DUF6755 family protein [Polyangiaceae bacterium]|nr:DUF6755 family protein [Polyangiaceae bacterium]
MNDQSRFGRSQRTTMVNGILVLVICTVIFQLWLLTATMEAYLGGDSTTAIPATLASAACLAINLGLLRWLYRLG